MKRQMTQMALIAWGFSMLMTAAVAPREAAVPFEPHRFHALLDRQDVSRLDGVWRFKPDPRDLGERERWFDHGIEDRSIVVPGSWEMAFEDMRNYRGVAWYERDVVVPPEWENRRIALVFSAVHYHPQVWVNGVFAGEHEGGLIPFALDISKFVRFDAPNRLTVKVTSPERVDEHLIVLQQYLIHRVSGLWRSVWIEATGPIFISDLHIMSDIDAPQAIINVQITAPPTPAARNMKLRVVIQDPNGRSFSQETAVTLRQSDKPFSASCEISMPIDRPALWSPDQPHLYRATVTLLGRDDIVDTAATDFGMRKIDIEGIHIRLNNKPIFLMGALFIADAPNRNYYLASYRPVSDEQIRAELNLAKQMGFNMLRIPIHVEDHRYYYWADRLGIFLYAEPPMYANKTAAAKERWLYTLEGMIRRDRNRPSVLLWGFFNENTITTWPEAEAREKVQAAREIVARLDPARLVIENSGGWDAWFPFVNRLVFRNDIEDLHICQKSGPEAHHNTSGEPDRSVASFIDRRVALNYSSLRATNRPLLISELGGYLFMEEINRIQRLAGGALPWALTRVPLDSPETDSVSLVEGYHERFGRWGLDEIFGDFERFVEASDWSVYANMIKYDIEELRKNSSVSGYVLSQWNNFGQVPHGIISYYNQPRAFHEDLANIQRPDLVLIGWQELNVWSGEAFVAPILFSHFSGEPVTDATVHWRMEGHEPRGTISGVSLSEAGVHSVGRIEFVAPSVEKGVKARLDAEVVANGRTISKNYQDIFIYPETYRTRHTRHVFNEYMTTPQTFAAAGYETHMGIDPAIPVTVTRVFDEHVADYVAGGGTALLLVRDQADIKHDLGLRIGLGGFGPHYGGGLHLYRYIKPASGLFDRIPYENPIGWTFYKVIKHHAIAGIGKVHSNDVLAGAYGAWIRSDIVPKVAPREEVLGLIIQGRYQAGRLVITTFDRLGAWFEDPVARIMFQDLLEYCFSSFEPQTSLPLGKTAAAGEI